MKNPEIRRRVAEKNRAITLQLYREHPELKEKIKKATRKAMQRPEVRAKTQKTWFKKGERSSPRTEFKKGSIPWTKGKPRPIKTKRKIRNTLRELYKNNPEYLKKILTFRRPNKSEEILDSWIQSYFPKEFVFVGNGSFIIEGSNPDWVGCGGKRQIIELFGEPWHNPEEEQLRKNRFAKLGYHTLVIWYEELKDKKSVLGKIRNFIEAS